MGALRGQGCTNRARSESEISVSSAILLQVYNIYVTDTAQSVLFVPFSSVCFCFDLPCYSSTVPIPGTH